MTIEDGIGWTWVSNQDKEALRGLQSFQYTTDRPKSPGGRALRHPKPWELEVQSYFRDRGCGRAKKRGTRRLLLARRSGVIVAAADTEVSISKDGDGSYVNFFICACIVLRHEYVEIKAAVLVNPPCLRGEARRISEAQQPSQA